MESIMNELLSLFGLTNEMLSDIDNLKEFLPIFIRLCLVTGFLGMLTRFVLNMSGGFVKARYYR